MADDVAGLAPGLVAGGVGEEVAAAIVLAHNHPSGTVQPSRADEALTQTLKAALALVDVRVGTSFPIGNYGLGLMFNPAAGVRFRLLDDVQGYGNERGGNLAGNLSIAPHVGALIGSPGAGKIPAGGH